MLKTTSDSIRIQKNQFIDQDIECYFFEATPNASTRLRESDKKP